MLTVLAGSICIGFIIPRGKMGHEAYDADEQPLGVFPSQQEAAAAIERART
jgi:hypothetical protein